MECKCGVNLEVKGAVQRAYLGKRNAPTKHGLGHYNKDGDYEPDRIADLTAGSYDTVDGCDTCAKCGAVVG
jgi:hypothetical protein